MLTILFTICLIWLFIKLVILSVKAAWGITKFVFTVILFPLILIGLVVGGLINIAFPLLLIVGIIVIIASKA